MAPADTDPSPTPQGLRISATALDKRFVLHAQGGVEIPVMRRAELTVASGECVALIGESGAGKSTLMRMLYGNYRAGGGHARVAHFDSKSDARWIDVATAPPHDILELRRLSLGYVSQFLRVIPRVSALDIVAEPAIAAGVDRERALERARELLTQLRVRDELWPLSPLTFSGGEQQRVNVARGFSHAFPTLLLDEPTASLDARNRETVLSMIEQARNAGAGIVGIFHDQPARERLASRLVDVASFAPPAFETERA